jgi:hypothetical protein
LQQSGMENLKQITAGGPVDSRLGTICVYGANTVVNEYTSVGGVAVTHDPAGI